MNVSVYIHDNKKTVKSPLTMSVFSPCTGVVASSPSLIRDVVIPVVSVVAVLALVVLVGAVYGYIKVFAHLLKLKNPQTGTAKLL